ncbi:MAG TPA: DAK2 domain-containing protein [Dehalococcoidia bacterium]|nr:DAK2 domain-containing protein [Dehalococcoidia bacterium]
MTSPTVTALSGSELRELFAAAMVWLERHADRVNAVNVFPVPDGDTGTNMFLTMRSTMQEAEGCTDDSVGGMLAAMSHGALMGARGNSGVILSQIIRGMAQAGQGMTALDAAGFVAGLEQGAAAAYKAVTKPVEGTILTVVREVAEDARKRLNGSAPDLVPLLESVVDAARESVARTPTLLPVLAEAGVVDAGGLGLSYLLEGMLRRLKDEPLEVDESEAEGVGQDWLEMTEQRHATEESLYGYCTEVLVAGSDLDPDAIRAKMLALGDSVLVVGDESLARVHVHTDDPGAVLSQGTSVGSLMQVKVDNIRRQAEKFVQMHEERLGAPEEAPAVCVVAVVAGEGMAEVFQSVGCTRVVSGGPTMNPSTKDILDAVEGCPSEDVVVLPNDKNIIMAAHQAVGLTKKRLLVVPTCSMPQGIAALLAMNPEEGLDENAQAMEEGRQMVRTVEVTRAVRSTSIGGVNVEAGQCIAIVDDELKLAAATPEMAALQALEGLAGQGTSLVTLYYGAGTDEARAKALGGHLCERLAGYEVEVVYGGQPHYDYVISVE